ncbi:MAG: ecotin family protein [Syntrophales bacterium]
MGNTSLTRQISYRSGEPYLIRYNNRLPIVVYAPEGVEVCYRVVDRGAETQVVENG